MAYRKTILLIAFCLIVSVMAFQSAAAQGNEDDPNDPNSEDEEDPSASDEQDIDVDIEYEGEEVVVTGERREDAAPASQFDMDVGQLDIIPRKNVSEHLMLAPGILTTNHGGEGHAHETFMRGFAAREGQDIEFTVDGVPLNEISNPHGHGYADLMFIPPEFVRSVVISEGPFDPAQGDFAFAGSADYRLGVRDRGSLVQYGYGAWDSHRTLLLIAPEKMDTETFAGFEHHRSQGFGENRASQRATFLSRYAQNVDNLNLRWKLSAYSYAARFDQAGVVRQDDYESGEMGFFDTYDPNQGGESNRWLLTFDTENFSGNSFFHQVSFFGYRTMRLRANFTGWLTDDLTDGESFVADEQRGDNIEMRYNVMTAGSRGDYTLFGRWLDQEQSLTLGYALRYDQGNSSQSRLRAITAIPYKRVFDNDFTILNIAGWGRANFRPCNWYALRGGLRYDTFSFGVTDNNQPESDREGNRVPDQTAQAFGYAINPRATFDFTLYDGLHLLTSYGQSTRSTEAAALSDNETAPFALAHSAEGGLAYAYGNIGKPFAIKLQSSYVYTWINKDMLFDEFAGRNVLVGSSTRQAVLLGTRMYLGTWFDSLLNVGWTKATLDDTGELLPYIPEWVVRLDTAAHGQLFGWKLGSVPVDGHIGVGFTYVPGRPLPLKEFGDPMYLLNAGAEIRLWHFSLGAQGRNLLNLQYRQSEFNYASNFDGADATPTLVPERHFVAGEPLFWMGTLSLHVEDLIRNFI